jgi:hypothetical protein
VFPRAATLVVVVADVAAPIVTRTRAPRAARSMPAGALRDVANTPTRERERAKAVKVTAAPHKSAAKSTRHRDDGERASREHAKDASTTASARKRVRENEMHALVKAFEDAGAWIEATLRRHARDDC